NSFSTERHGRCPGGFHLLCRAPACNRRCDRARRLVFTRQKQREGAAFAGDAGDANLAAQQASNLATNRKAKAGTAVLATRRTVRLLESFKDDSLLLRRNANPCIAD